MLPSLNIMNDTITFPMKVQPYGSRCTITGTYSFKGYKSSPLIIPPVICDVLSSTLQGIILIIKLVMFHSESDFINAVHTSSTSSTLRPMPSGKGTVRR